MEFCIELDKNRDLSKLLSEILSIIKVDEGVDALLFSSYLIHQRYVDEFFSSPLKDGININLTLVVNDDREEIQEFLKTFVERCASVLNYNLIFSTISKSSLQTKTSRLESILADGEILFDKTGETSFVKLFTFKNPSAEIITYEPKLEIRG